MDEQLTRCIDGNGNAEVAWVCPATPDKHRVAELERQLEEANHLMDQGAKHQESEIHRLRSQLRASQERELALRKALDALVKKSYHRRNCDQAYGDPLCECGREDACVLAWDALDNTSAAAAQTVDRIEREALEKLGCGIQAIAAERKRQIEAEGWTPEHDDEHDDGELAQAGASCALGGVSHWPWDLNWWKPSTPKRNLEKAGALIAAEIDRLDRAALFGEKENGNG